MAKKHSEYFDSFITLAKLSSKAATYLQSVLQSFNPESLPAEMIKLHDIEHTADEEKHEMMQKLAKEFVTPIEREDIILLANELDEVTDKVEDVLIRIFMYNINEIRPEALKFADVIVRCCTALETAMIEFPNFHKSNTLHQAIVEVNTMEEEGDALYIESMRALFVEAKDPITVMAWSEMFDKLEDCCDACEHVANILESVIMKNS